MTEPKLTLDSCPAKMKKIIADITNEFKKKGHAVARIRVSFPGEKYITNNIVQEGMHLDHGRPVIEALMILAAVKGAECVSLVMEGWRVAVNPENEFATKLALEYAKDRELHRHHARKECLMVSYQDAEKEVSAMAEIKRNPTKLSQWDFSDVVFENERAGLLQKFPDAEPRFSGIFRKAKQPEKVEWAQRVLAVIAATNSFRELL